MKRMAAAKVALLAGMLLTAGALLSATLMPELARARYPRIFFFGNVNYSAVNGDLQVTGVPTDVQFAHGGPLSPVTAPALLDIKAQILDPFGKTVVGIGTEHLQVVGTLDVNGNGSIEAGETGVMLTGSS
jgi:hypothetical protein